MTRDVAVGSKERCRSGFSYGEDPIMVFLSTGAVSEALGVCPKTACNWIDSQKLRGFRVPGSSHRRVTEEEMWRFIAKHDLPTEGLLGVLSRKKRGTRPSPSLSPDWDDDCPR